MNTQFLTDSEGGKVAGVIPIQEYHSLMEDVADLARAAERRDDEQEPTVPAAFGLAITESFTKFPTKVCLWS